jgi:metacaspase-1
MVLTDEPYLNPKYMPTKRNILNALRWLVKDAQPGDCLFFHCEFHNCHFIKTFGDPSSFWTWRTNHRLGWA